MDIVVFGALGRVGRKTVQLAKKRGHNVWEKDENYEKNPLPSVDAAIDFSVPEATSEICGFCREFNCPLVTGTTDRNEEEQASLTALKECVAVSEKANFSRGIAAVCRLLELAVKLLPDFDAEIVETHRKGKKDSPSGTAKLLAGIAAENKGSFSSVAVHSLRCGTNFGRHEIVLGGSGESVTITHQAENVEVFAAGAIYEAETLVKKAKPCR